MERLLHLRRLHAFIFLFAIAITTAGCVVQRNPITGQRRAYGWTWEQEVQMGREADQQIVAQFGLYDDPDLTAYVNRIADEVLAESHVRRPDAPSEYRNTEFTFRVLDSPVVNAFALPGGFVYVTRGLLSHLENEAQLAVVLGHEIGHVVARHASQRAFEQQLGQIGLIGGAIIGQEVLGGAAGQTILDLGGTAAQLLLLSYSRDDERESDQLGVEYAARSGYEASEASGFFRALQRLGEREGALPSWQSSHPDPGEREQSMISLANEWRDETNMTRVNQDALYNAIEGMVVGENPRQGFTQNNRFYHPELRFHFPVPQGYQVVNQPTQVVMVEPNQQAILGLTIAQQNSLQAAASQFASQQGLSVVDQGSATSAGNSAYYVLADAQTEQGQVLRILSFFVEHGGNIYNFMGYSARESFSNYQDTFLRTMRNLETLNDQSILNVQPFTLNVQAAGQTAPFSNFVPQNLPPQLSPRDVAIMNHVELDEQVSQGTPLKIPTR